jgi:hypothetical protein
VESFSLPFAIYTVCGMWPPSERVKRLTPG